MHPKTHWLLHWQLNFDIFVGDSDNRCFKILKPTLSAGWHDVLIVILYFRNSPYHSKRNTSVLEFVHINKLFWDQTKWNFLLMISQTPSEDQVQQPYPEVCIIFHLESKLQHVQCSFLLQMNIDIWHKACSIDACVPLWLHYTSYSLHTNKMARWISIRFLLLGCKNLVIPHTSMFAFCFIVAVIFVVMSQIHVLNINVDIAIKISCCFEFKCFKMF